MVFFFFFFFGTRGLSWNWESLSATKAGILNGLSSTKVSYSEYNKSSEERVPIFVCYQLGDDFGLDSVLVVWCLKWDGVLSLYVGRLIYVDLVYSKAWQLLEKCSLRNKLVVIYHMPQTVLFEDCHDQNLDIRNGVLHRWFIYEIIIGYF